jgi:hypothetical protein
MPVGRYTLLYREHGTRLVKCMKMLFSRKIIVIVMVHVAETKLKEKKRKNTFWQNFY